MPPAAMASRLWRGCARATRSTRVPVVAQQEVDRHGLGELGRPPEATVALVDLGEPARRRPQ